VLNIALALPSIETGRKGQKGAERSRKEQISIILVSLDRHLSAYMDICGACERIRSTPLALSYRAFRRQGIALNLIILPLYSASALPLVLSVPISVIASYFLIGLELIAEEIEDPFGHDSDDLPLDTICERICTVSVR
jgi:putative membrane protein